MKRLRLNKYTKVVENDKMIIYDNCLYGSRMAVNKALKEQIDEYLERGVVPDEETKKVIACLYKAKILSDAAMGIKTEEQECLQQMANPETDLSTVYFMPTLTCNLRCVYCVIGTSVCGNETERFMEKETIFETAEFIVREAMKQNKKMLQVLLFGGEPTMAIEQNAMLMERVNELVKTTDLQLQYVMITNGYNLKEKDVDRLIALGLTQIQITLDGPKEIHDKRRVNVGGNGTFEQIIENMRMLKDKRVAITIRVNVDQNNCDLIEDLLKYMYEEGFSERIYVQFAPVDPSDYSQSTGYEKETLEKFDRMYSVANEYGIPYGVWTRSCSTNQDGQFAVAPNGDLYKCPLYVGKPEAVVGNVKAGLNDNSKKFRERQLRERCKKCEILPHCNGGCEPMREGAGLEDFCFKEANETIVRTYLKNKYNKDYKDIAKERLSNVIDKFF